MLKIIFDKILNHEKLTNDEYVFFTQWIEQNSVPFGEAVSKAVSQYIGSRTNIQNLSTISNQLGLITAGEFRTGNGKAPGDGFTGGRFGYPGFTYNGRTYFLVGVNNDVMQVGLDLSDGTIKAGGGNVILDANGIRIANAANFFAFENHAGVANIEFFVGNDDIFWMSNQNPGMKIILSQVLSDNSTARIYLRESAVNSKIAQLRLEPGTEGARLAVGDDHFIDTVKFDGTGSATVYFNERNKDIDFNVQTVNSNNGLFMDASLNKATSFAWDGWWSVHETWTRTGNYTFTISGDVTAKYKPGTNVRFTDGTVKYGVIASSAYSAPDTTVTLITNSDYLMTANPSALYISYIDAEGFPEWFNWTPTLTGFSADPTNSVYRWKCKGKEITLLWRQATNGTSNATTFTMSLPVTAATITNMMWANSHQYIDNSTTAANQGACTILSGGTTMSLFVASASGAWTNVNGKRSGGGFMVYEF